MKLEEYDYEIDHKAGKANANADALSRNVPAIICQVGKENENEIVKDYSNEEKQQILYEYHDASTGDHQGVERTLNRIRTNYTWSGITKDVERYIAKCELCQKNKLARRARAPLIITDIPDKPFQKCALHIVGPLTPTNENKYLLSR